MKTIKLYYMDKDEADIMINKNYTANLEITFDVIKQ